VFKGACLRACSLTNSAQRAAIMSPAASLAPLHFLTLSHKRHGFRKQVTKHKMCVLTFSTTCIWNISHPNKNLTTYCHKRENVFTQSTRYSYWILIKPGPPYQIFEKSSNIKFHPHPSRGSRVVPYGQTDMTKLTVRNFANAPTKNVNV
jgi:hypothetical protein